MGVKMHVKWVAFKVERAHEARGERQEADERIQQEQMRFDAELALSSDLDLL